MWGGIAQLVERLNGIQKVMGSTPFTSTRKTPGQPGVFPFRPSAAGVMQRISEIWITLT